MIKILVNKFNCVHLIKYRIIYMKQIQINKIILDACDEVIEKDIYFTPADFAEAVAEELNTDLDEHAYKLIYNYYYQ